MGIACDPSNSEFMLIADLGDSELGKLSYEQQAVQMKTTMSNTTIDGEIKTPVFVCCHVYA